MASRSNQNFETCAPWKSLEGKVVLVTGASSGIGKEICLDLARAGCQVVAAARRVDQLKKLCDEINGWGSASKATSPARAVGVWMDVSKEEGIIAEAVKRAWDSFGRIDALVNNAGIRGISIAFYFLFSCLYFTQSWNTKIWFLCVACIILDVSPHFSISFRRKVTVFHIYSSTL
jgi:short chain dehydrogenase